MKEMTNFVETDSINTDPAFSAYNQMVDTITSTVSIIMCLDIRTN